RDTSLHGGDIGSPDCVQLEKVSGLRKYPITAVTSVLLIVCGWKGVGIEGISNHGSDIGCLNCVQLEKVSGLREYPIIATYCET
ncbi:MAG: hypothetical protein K2P63_11770, partial [Lachnospiraceae bacterium]|nr:hypothetical protein [Lachnospiraceae bacterium]